PVRLLRAFPCRVSCLAEVDRSASGTTIVGPWVVIDSRSGIAARDLADHAYRRREPGLANAQLAMEWPCGLRDCTRRFRDWWCFLAAAMTIPALFHLCGRAVADGLGDANYQRTHGSKRCGSCRVAELVWRAR